MHEQPGSIAPKHVVDEISQRSPEILSTRKIMLVDEENVVLEAGIEMSLKAKFSDDGIVMAIYVGVDAVHPLEDLPNHAWE